MIKAVTAEIARAINYSSTSWNDWLLSQPGSRIYLFRLPGRWAFLQQSPANAVLMLLTWNPTDRSACNLFFFSLLTCSEQFVIFSTAFASEIAIHKNIFSWMKWTKRVLLWKNWRALCQWCGINILSGAVVTRVLWHDCPRSEIRAMNNKYP